MLCPIETANPPPQVHFLFVLYSASCCEYNSATGIRSSESALIGLVTVGVRFPAIDTPETTRSIPSVLWAAKGAREITERQSLLEFCFSAPPDGFRALQEWLRGQI